MVLVSTLTETKYSDAVIEFKAHRTCSPLYLKALSVVLVLQLVVMWFMNMEFTRRVLVLEACLTMGVVMAWILVLSSIKEESVLVVKDFGIQISRKSCFGSEYKRFIDRETINRLFVHEYIEGASVHYCLAFMIQGDSSLELCYRYVYPGLSSLQKIFSLCSDEVGKESKERRRSTTFS